MADTTSTALGHHFDDLGQQRQAVTLAMWVFLATEVLFFGAILVVFSSYRLAYPQAWEAASHHLDLVLGTTNTAVLLVSSFFMALGVHGAEHGRRSAALWLGLTVLLALAFLGIKGYEWHHEITLGRYPGGGDFQFEGTDALRDQASLFFSFYFVMTGLHGLHVIIGVGLIAGLAVLAWRGRVLGEASNPVTMAGLYWHFVDVVWIYLFPLLYLVGVRE